MRVDGLLMILALFLMGGCASTSPMVAPNGTKMTLGTAQKSIRKGMDQAEVASSMGSPNIVTRDKSGNETWVYDKISSEVSYSTSEAYGSLLLIGGSTNKGYSSSSQKTLTIVIKFDENMLVDTFTYHSSRF